MNQVNKPVTMLRDELVMKITSAINDSGLPLFLTEYIMKDILSEVHNGAVQQAKRDKAQYLQMEAQAAKADTEAESVSEQS